MTKKINKKSVRLPTNISPVKYNLTIKPDLESSTFSGGEIIDIKILKQTKSITLHSKDVDIETVSISQNKKSYFSSKISYDIKSETAIIIFPKLLLKGKAKLSIIFSGIINENLRGLYKSKYEIDGKEKYLATTQFEATDARRAFPCFDEPAHKAIFEVSLIIPNAHTAISNTLPINIKEHSIGYKIVSFSPTPIMSTYLLAFISGEFEYVEGWTKKEKKFGNKATLVKVYTTPGKKHQAQFALDIAIRSLEFYNEYFNIPYPLPTLDLIAIPDFESGAMENWGAVTFRESAILVDEERTSLSNKQWVAIVIAHELAHQWFGNLVTMSWWTDLWLNEGFASYMENFCIDKLFPHWNIWNLYLADRYTVALKLDSLNNSHPIEIEVHHPNEINEIFDMVSYAKGSAVIRMLAEYIGEEKFRDGLRYYLKKHSYKNTKTTNLWNSFEKVSGKPVEKMMNSWTKQTGYPLICISSMAVLGENLWLTQERFFSSRIMRRQNESRSLWQIPVNYEFEKDGKEINQKVLMKNKSIRLINNSIGKINKNEVSFARVRYDKETLESLKKEIIENRMNVADRLGIVRDIFALAEGGYIKTSEALEFPLAYKDEREFIVWSEIASGINKINNIISKEESNLKYKKYVLSLFSPLKDYMSFEKKQNDNHSDTFLRNLAVSMSGIYGDKETIKEARKIFSNKIIKPIEADIRGAVYSIVASNGRSMEWEEFKKMYIKETLYEEKERISKAMMAFRNKKEITNNLSFVMSKEVRGQDFPQMLAMLWQNENARDEVWSFVKKNWKHVLENYGEGGHFLSRVLTTLGNHTDIKTLKNAKSFFKKNSAPGSERTLLQAYEKIESNAAWLKDDKKDIEKWLNKNF